MSLSFMYDKLDYSEKLYCIIFTLNLLLVLAM